MTGCWYGDSQYGYKSWQLRQNGSTPFDADPTYLNMQNFSNNNLLAIPVNFPDPSNSGGYGILWLWVNSS